jgi:hypothetical protein
MCAGADEDYGAGFAAFIKPVDQQEIAADMAFAVPIPAACSATAGPVLLTAEWPLCAQLSSF